MSNLFIDVGANSGEATLEAIRQGAKKVIALEPAPRAFAKLVSNFIYFPQVIPLKMAVSDTNGDWIDLYEADEDGLSSINKDWLTDQTLPYAGKPYRVVKAQTVTINQLVEDFGEPDLIKIDIEGAEWSAFRGMSKAYPMTFEWTKATIDEHDKQLKYLQGIGYTRVAPQFIVEHLREPSEWFDIEGFSVRGWVENHSIAWESRGWQVAGLRPTADAGMCWLK